MSELEDDRRVPETIKARLGAIRMYEAKRSRIVVLSDLDCLADLEISKGPT